MSHIGIYFQHRFHRIVDRHCLPHTATFLDEVCFYSPYTNFPLRNFLILFHSGISFSRV